MLDLTQLRFTAKVPLGTLDTNRVLQSNNFGKAFITRFRFKMQIKLDSDMKFRIGIFSI